jgi:hypothetical protein
VPREVSAYLTVFPKQASPIQEGLSPGCPMQCRWKCTFGLMPRFFRKTYCLPLSPRRCGEPFISLVVQLQSAASEHRDVRLRYAAYLSPFSSSRPQAPRSSPLNLAGACLPYPKRTKHCTPQPRNLDTEQPFSYCYELPTQLRLESVATRTPPPICTSTLGSLTALVWRA